jgi:type II secretory pathway pseudopilin PulG
VKSLKVKVFVAILLTAVIGRATESYASGIPTCDSKQATDMLKEAIENSAYTNIEKVQLLDWDNLSEEWFDKDEGIRKCIVHVTLNTGSGTVFYTFSQAKSDPSKVLIKVRPLNQMELYIRTTAAQGAQDSQRMLREEKEQHAMSYEQRAQQLEQAQSKDQAIDACYHRVAGTVMQGSTILCDSNRNDKQIEKCINELNACNDHPDYNLTDKQAPLKQTPVQKDSPCKPYTTPNGIQSGTACKQKDGTWKIKSTNGTKKAKEIGKSTPTGPGSLCSNFKSQDGREELRCRNGDGSWTAMP